MSADKDFKPDDTWSEEKKHDYNTSLMVLGLILFALLASAFLHLRGTSTEPAVKAVVEVAPQTALAASATMNDEILLAPEQASITTAPTQIAQQPNSDDKTEDSPLAFFSFYKELPKRQVLVYNAQPRALRKLETTYPKLQAPPPLPKPGMSEISLPPPPSQSQPLAPPALDSSTFSSNNHGRGYIIQAGAFNQFVQADKVRGRLALLDFKAYVEPGQIGNLRVHRVRIGPIANAARAKSVRKTLDSKGIPAITIGPRTH